MKPVSEMNPWDIDAYFWRAVVHDWTVAEQNAIAQHEMTMAFNNRTIDRREAEQAWERTLAEEPPDDDQ